MRDTEDDAMAGYELICAVTTVCSVPLSFIRYYSERGDAVAKASKQAHVVSVLCLHLSDSLS